MSILRYKRFLLSASMPVIAFAAACSSGSITYVPERDFNFDTINVSGLTVNQNIIELSDIYQGLISDGNSYFVLISEKGKNYFIGELDMSSGQLTKKEPFREEYGDKNSIYWETLIYDDKGGAGKFCNFCCSLTPIGGESYYYGFKTKKSFWANTDEYVELSYFYSRKESVNYSAGAVNAGGTPCVVCWPSDRQVEERYVYEQIFYSDGHIFKPERFYGLENGFEYESIKKIRSYPLGKNLYLAFHPYSINPYNKCMFFYFDMNLGNSWGVDYDFKDSNYIDGAVSKDGNIIYILINKDGRYYILRLQSAEYRKSIVNLKSV